jgi:hypothetical protein
MTNTTDVYWDVDGTSLHTYVRQIRTLGGERDTVPGWRGSDRVFAYKAGAEPRPMVADSRTLTLLATLLGREEDGTSPEVWRDSFTAKRREFKRLFWKPRGALFALTKRWDEGDGVVAATAHGRLANRLAGDMWGPYGQSVSVDVFLPDPFFYGAEITSGAGTVDNIGDDAVTRMTIVFSGAGTLTNSTNGVSVTVAEACTLDVHAGTALASGVNKIGGVTHAGAQEWMRLERGSNVLTGAGTVTFRPAYL